MLLLALAVGFHEDPYCSHEGEIRENSGEFVTEEADEICPVDLAVEDFHLQTLGADGSEAAV